MINALATERRLSALAIHDGRADFLDALAALLGCVTPISTTLPDGARPDVLRVGLESRMLFIGDGKNTETPTCAATEARLRRYFAWARAHADLGGRAVVALCFGAGWQSFGWRTMLTGLAAEAGLETERSGADTFGADYVAWVALRARPRP